jgi:hypothetical protein
MATLNKCNRKDDYNVNYIADCSPPEATIFSPVMYDESSDAKNEAEPAISSGFPFLHVIIK